MTGSPGVNSLASCCHCSQKVSVSCRFDTLVSTVWTYLVDNGRQVGLVRDIKADNDSMEIRQRQGVGLVDSEVGRDVLSLHGDLVVIDLHRTCRVPIVDHSVVHVLLFGLHVSLRLECFAFEGEITYG